MKHGLQLTGTILFVRGNGNHCNKKESSIYKPLLFWRLNFVGKRDPYWQFNDNNIIIMVMINDNDNNDGDEDNDDNDNNNKY